MYDFLGAMEIGNRVSVRKLLKQSRRGNAEEMVRNGQTW